MRGDAQARLAPCSARRAAPAGKAFVIIKNKLCMAFQGWHSPSRCHHLLASPPFKHLDGGLDWRYGRRYGQREGTQRDAERIHDRALGEIRHPEVDKGRGAAAQACGWVRTQHGGRAGTVKQRRPAHGGAS